MLVRIYEDQALSMKYVYEWVTHFREGRESISDNSRSGRLAISVCDENVEKVRYSEIFSEYITKDRQLTVRMIVDEL
ncbi:hypothetical protein TNCV_3133451 [Trichonephila clavipes]|nr:hypothetical protein TNCV_3133451 [Trichonephila clavipes]